MYFVLILVSCFVVLFSVLFRPQLSMVRPNRPQVVELSSLVFLCLSAPSHKNGFSNRKTKVLETILVRRRTSSSSSSMFHPL